MTVFQLRPWNPCLSICPVWSCGFIAADRSCLYFPSSPLFPVDNGWQASGAGLISYKKNADTAKKKGLDLQVMWVNLWSTRLCWHSSGAIGVLHSAGSHLVRPRQKQLVGLISPARAVLRSSLHKLLQTAAAGLDRDLQRTTVSTADWRSGTESMLAFNQISVIKLSARLLPRWRTFSRAFTTSFFLKMAS